MSQFKSKDGEIYEPFPLEIYQKYIQQINVKDESELTFSKLVTLMVNIITDLKNEKISTQDFSDIFEVLYTYFFEKQSEKKKDIFSEIGIVLFNGAELNYYAESDSKNAQNSTYKEYLNSLMHFYNMRETIKKNIDELDS